MKKSIIVLALALLMVGSVFAAETAPLYGTGTENQQDLIDKLNPSTKDTNVKIQLKQYPQYMTAITTAKYDSTNKIVNAGSEGTVYTNVKHNDLIELTVNKDTWKLGAPSTQYYVTYYAYENTQNAAFTITMNGNLKLQDTVTLGTADTKAPTWSGDSTTSDADKQKQIRYQMTINGDTIYSFGTKDGTEKNSVTFAQVPLTKLIGQSTFGSYAITFAGYSTDTVQYNIVGTYLATVTLAITTY